MRATLAIWLLLPALAGVAVGEAGCARRETNVERGDRAQVLYRGIGSAVSSLDPQLITGLAGQSVVSALFEGLVTEDPHDLHPVPGVAKSWTVSPDGLVYTFHLRTDAKWSDGRPVTAADFIAAYRRMLAPSLGADYASAFYAVAGAEDYNRDRLKDFSKVGFAAPDPHTLRITLRHPTSYFLELLTQTFWLPVPVDVIRRYGDPYRRGNSWTLPGHLVGNGPFDLKSWTPNVQIVVDKSPTYWDAAHVRLHAIHFYPIDSQDAEERAFRAGQLHITYTVPVTKVEAYRRNDPQLLRIDPYFDTYFFRLNVRRTPFNDPRIRQALSLAIDRRAIVQHLLHGGQQPATSFTPSGLPDYTPPALVKTDVTEARRLLAAAGYPDGHGLPPLTLLYNTSDNHRLLAEAVQEMWRRALGIDVQLENQELKVVLQERQQGQYQILLSDWVGDYLDASTFLDVLRSDNGNNHTGWSDAAYDRLLTEADRTTNPAARARLMRRAETRMLEAMPVIPLYFNTHVFLIRPSVHGWYPTLLDHHPYKDVWLQSPAPGR